MTISAIPDGNFNVFTYVGTPSMNIVNGDYVGAIIEPAQNGKQPDFLILEDPSGYAGFDLSTVAIAAYGGRVSILVEIGPTIPTGEGALALTWAGAIHNASSTAPTCRALKEFTVVSKVPGQLGKTFIGDSSLATWGPISDSTFNSLPNGMPVARILNPFTGSSPNTHIDRWTFKVPRLLQAGNAVGNYCVYNQFDSSGEYSLGLEFSKNKHSFIQAVIGTDVTFTGQLMTLSSQTGINVPISAKITYPAGQSAKVYLGSSSMNPATGAGVYRDLVPDNDYWNQVFEVSPRGAYWTQSTYQACYGTGGGNYSVYAIQEAAGLTVYANPQVSGLTIAVENLYQPQKNVCVAGPPGIIQVPTYNYRLQSFTSTFGTTQTQVSQTAAFAEFVEFSIRAGQYGYHKISNSIGDVAWLHNDQSVGVGPETYKIEAPAGAFNLQNLLVSSDYANQSLNIVVGYQGTSIPTSSYQTMVPVVGGQVASSTTDPTPIGSGNFDLGTFRTVPGNWVKVGLFSPLGLTQPDSSYTAAGQIFWPNVNDPTDNAGHSQSLSIKSPFAGSGVNVAGYSANQGLFVGAWRVQ